MNKNNEQYLIGKQVYINNKVYYKIVEQAGDNIFKVIYERCDKNIIGLTHIIKEVKLLRPFNEELFNEMIYLFPEYII